MTSTTVLAMIGGIVVILVAAARIPAAAAELIRACILVVDALKDLRAALRRSIPQTDVSGASPRPTSVVPDRRAPRPEAEAAASDKRHPDNRVA
jgi:Sec-independent protein translocase protein TatA